MFPVGAGFDAAGFVFPAFLFCVANADVPARANANTTVIRILFIIVLRRFFLAVNSTPIAGAILVRASRDDEVQGACPRWQMRDDVTNSKFEPL
jgi:hypothetical protein